MFKTRGDDGVPQWRLIYNYVTGAEPEIGHLFSHEELREQLSEGSQSGYYTAVRDAAKHLQSEDQRTLIVVRGEGYEYSGGLTQIEQAQGQRKRARRSLTRASHVASWTDDSLISPTDRSYADKVRGAIAALAVIAKQHDRKLIEMSRDLEILREAHVRTDVRAKKAEEDAAAAADKAAAATDQMAEFHRRLSELEASRRR